MEVVDFLRLYQKTEQNVHKLEIEHTSKIDIALLQHSLFKLNQLWLHLASSGDDSRFDGICDSTISLASYRNKIDTFQKNLNQMIHDVDGEKNEYASSSSESFLSGGENNQIEYVLLRNKLANKTDLLQVLEVEEPDDESTSVEEKLKQQRHEQEKLTEDILLIVNELKNTSLQSFNIVKEDNSKLVSVEKKVEANIEKVLSILSFTL